VGKQASRCGAAKSTISGFLIHELKDDVILFAKLIDEK
jgi:hypothetical protein